MMVKLQDEINWLRSCFRSYDVDEDGLRKIAQVILDKNKEIERLKVELRKDKNL